GRKVEFRLATGLLSRLNPGPEALVIEGEQGIGKTTLLLKVLGRAREMGYHVMVARPSKAEVTLQFAALGDLLERISDTELSNIPPPQRRALNALLLKAEPMGTELGIRDASVALLGILRELAGRSQVLLAIDDAHW